MPITKHASILFQVGYTNYVVIADMERNTQTMHPINGTWLDDYIEAFIALCEKENVSHVHVFHATPTLQASQHVRNVRSYFFPVDAQLEEHIQDIHMNAHTC